MRGLEVGLSGAWFRSGGLVMCGLEVRLSGLEVGLSGTWFKSGGLVERGLEVGS